MSLNSWALALVPMKSLGNAIIKIVTGGTKTTLNLLSVIDIFHGPSNFCQAKLSWCTAS